MKDKVKKKTVGSYLDLKSDIEIRIQLLSYWKNKINLELKRVLSKNPIDEIKDLLVQIEESLSRNLKLKVAIFIEENPDFHAQKDRGLHS